MKTYTQQDLAKKYGKLTSGKQVAILYDAIDFMQQYNGRTRNECIFMAMGYETRDGISYTKEEK